MGTTVMTQGNIMGTTMNIMGWVRRQNSNLLDTTTTNIMGWVRRRPPILWAGYDDEYYGLGTTTNIIGLVRRGILLDCYDDDEKAINWVRRRNSNSLSTTSKYKFSGYDDKIAINGKRWRRRLWDRYDDEKYYGTDTTTTQIMGWVRRREILWDGYDDDDENCNELGTTTTIIETNWAQRRRQRKLQ